MLLLLLGLEKCGGRKCIVCEEKHKWADTENRSLEVISLYGASYYINHKAFHSGDTNRMKLSPPKFQWQLVWT